MIATAETLRYLGGREAQACLPPVSRWVQDPLRGAPVVAALLGCAELDLVFADAVRATARATGAGTELPR